MTGTLFFVDTPKPAAPPAEETAPPAEETLVQVLDALKELYDVKEPAIADRIGVHVSTVNKWTNGKANPRPDAVRDLARYFPKVKARLLAAAQIRVPAPLSPDRKAVMLDVMDRLTEEQQELMLIQGKAWADSNDGKA